MARPNAKMKIKKDGVVFESNVDAVLWTKDELTVAALHDIARLLKYRVVARLRAETRVKPHRAKSGTQYWVRKRDKDLQIGFGNTKKGMTGQTYYLIGQELGDKVKYVAKDPSGKVHTGYATQPKKGILRRTVMESIPDIVRITDQYFKVLNEKDPNVDEHPEEIISND